MNVTVLGLDGATLDLIRPCVERGELPGFARLLREGAWGALRSTIPCDSPAAWTSFATGVNPGRHGVFGFMARRRGAYQYDIGSSALFRSPALWEIASRQGLRVGVLNVPFTYPPQPVNGYMVGGMMTPDRHSAFTWPPELRDELLREFPDYPLSHRLGRMQSGVPGATLVRDYAATIAARERAMDWLAAKYAPDLSIAVFTVLDRLQHFLWADMDARHPAHDPAGPRERREAIAAAYARLDGVVARALERAGRDSLVIVLSDHGFESVARTFHVNVWLAERGWLALTDRPRGEPGGWTKRWTQAARRLLRPIPGTARLRERLRARRLLSEAFVRAIDWPRTRAWFGPDRGLWINVAGRDPLGCVQPGEEYERARPELIGALEALVDPETGHRLIRAAHRKEAIYAGPALDDAPDIILEPARHPSDPSGRYILTERLGREWHRLATCRGPAARFVGPSAPISGNHTPEGIIMLWGKGVRAGTRLEGARIIDVSPTILHIMGMAGAEAMDGRVLAEAFEEASPPFLSPPRTGGKSVSPPSAGGIKGGEPGILQAALKCELRTPETPQPVLTDDERRLLEERLKDLGYLD
jgi:predicted AlkP superfamily phosphohydrolase/phosphomutase